MNKKMLINILLCFIFVAGLICFSLCWSWCINLWTDYRHCVANADEIGSSWYLDAALQLTFTEIFSALISVSSVIIFLTINLKK